MALAIAMVDEVADAEVDEETDASSTHAHTAKWTIIQLKHAERESTLKMSQTLAIQTPPGMTNGLATTAVSPDTSIPTASTSKVPAINVRKSSRAPHH